MTETAPSPLTDAQAPAIAVVPVARIVAAYRDQYRLDVAPYLPAIRELTLHRCPDTELEFFRPLPLAGRPEFYAELYRDTGWGYRGLKWEFLFAKQRLGDARSVLDLGCGGGDFLASLDGGVRRRVGLETSPLGRESSRAKGIEVHEESALAFCERHRSEFDAVTAFQVVEHLEDPLPFLHAAVTALRPGGTLVLSTPNKDAFLRYCRFVTLDHPPHHVSRWGRRTFEALTGILPVELATVEKEPLQPENFGWYRGEFEARYLPRARWRRALYYRIGAADGFARFVAEQASTIDGHTILAVYRRR